MIKCWYLHCDAKKSYIQTNVHDKRLILATQCIEESISDSCGAVSPLPVFASWNTFCLYICCFILLLIPLEMATLWFMQCNSATWSVLLPWCYMVAKCCYYYYNTSPPATKMNLFRVWSVSKNKYICTPLPIILISCLCIMHIIFI